MRPPSDSNSPRRSRPQTPNSHSSRAQTRPADAANSAAKNVPAEDIDDWLDRRPTRARGKTRRAIRQTASGDTTKKSAQPTPRVRKPKRSTVDFDRTRSQPRAARKAPKSKTSAPTATPRVRRPMWQRLRKLCIFLLLILAGEGVAATLSSSRFAVSEVAVEGAQETASEKLDAICASLVGQNFLRANRARAENLARAIPTIRTAHVRRDWTAWPPRLVLAVSERTPFARVGGGNSWQVVDESGMPFRAARREDAELLAVTGPRLQPEAGKAFEDKTWKPVVQFARLLKQDGEQAGGWNLRRVYFDRHGFASLRLTGGANDETLVQLGAGNWSEKLRTARWALADFAANNRHASAINLISSSVTTWTPRVVTNEESSAAENGTDAAPNGTRERGEASGDANPA